MLRFQRRAQRRAIEAGRVGIFLHRLALHEQPLAGVDRVQRVRPPGQRQQLVLDAEQRRDERYRDAGPAPRSARCRPFLQRRGVGPRRQQPRVQRRVLGREPVQERAVQPHQPGPVGEIIGEPRPNPRRGASAAGSASIVAVRPCCETASRCASHTPASSRAFGRLVDGRLVRLRAPARVLGVHRWPRPGRRAAVAEAASPGPGQCGETRFPSSLSSGVRAAGTLDTVSETCPCRVALYLGSAADAVSSHTGGPSDDGGAKEKIHPWADGRSRIDRCPAL